MNKYHPPLASKHRKIIYYIYILSKNLNGKKLPPPSPIKRKLIISEKNSYLKITRIIS